MSTNANRGGDMLFTDRAVKAALVGERTMGRSDMEEALAAILVECGKLLVRSDLPEEVKMKLRVMAAIARQQEDVRIRVSRAPALPGRRTPWSAAETALLIQLWQEKNPIEDIAMKLTRSESAVRTKAKKHGLLLPEKS
jgi:hypothetical protein